MPPPFRCAVFSARRLQVAGWGRGPNLGPREGVLDGMRHKLAEMHAATGRKVSVIGWSLGGVYARELARGAPEQVRQVITMGSPIYGDPATSSNAWGIYRAVSGRDGVATHERGEGPPPVPTTSIFTRTDGVVGWGCCIEKKGPLTDNIEIVGATHIGLGVHPLVLYAVGDRLAQPQDQWTHFNPRGPERALYPAHTPRPRSSRRLRPSSETQRGDKAMNHLSGLDATFLHIETAEMPMHVG